MELLLGLHASGAHSTWRIAEVLIADLHQPYRFAAIGPFAERDRIAKSKLLQQGA